MRCDTLGRLRVEEHVRLVCAPVDGRAAKLGEPDRLRLWHPCRRATALHPTRAVVMCVRPPGAQILGAEDPWLAGGAVGDQRAHLRGAVSVRGIEPVKAFPACNVRLQIRAVVDRRPALGRIGMIESVAPIRERHVIVDADEIDLRVGPERIEVEEHVAAAIAGLVTEIFRPVSGIADLCRRPENRPHIRRKVAQCLHRRISAGPRADRRQPAHLRADQEGIDPACSGAEMGVVQHHPAQAPVTERAGPADALSRNSKV